MDFFGSSNIINIIFILSIMDVMINKLAGTRVGAWARKL
jgi:hypothetical protein